MACLISFVNSGSSSCVGLSVLVVSFSLVSVDYFTVTILSGVTCPSMSSDVTGSVSKNVPASMTFSSKAGVAIKSFLDCSCFQMFHIHGVIYPFHLLVFQGVGSVS